ncbi:MAG: hypothetical protein JST54_34760 [Deltaproteobacteria bacterium]|nr:hypothetical protein [Deltaproteobacteria bacterium]
MDSKLRKTFNAHYSDALYNRFREKLTGELGKVEFPVAETPLFMDADLRELLARNAVEIVNQLSEPKRLAELKKAIPARYDTPGMDPLPNCVQVDFALVPGANGKLEGRVVELQAFPSLYAMEVFFCDAWGEQLSKIPGMPSAWTCFFHHSRAEAIALMRDTIVADADPAETVLLDLEPEHQKTLPDFIATQKLFGVESECVTQIIVEGKKLFRMRAGKKVPVKRIYNRMVFDELEAKNAKVPFRWNDDLDVTWCSHPNWYWVWSKFALPHIDHPAVPRARYLSTLDKLPDDLSRFVLKPLFSFAGTGVVIDVTREAIDKVPAEQRSGWVLQDKITYADALPMPDGNGVKAEVRMMLLRPPGGKQLEPLLPLVRLSRGKMIGVDHNKGMTWVGGSVGIWPA